MPDLRVIISGGGTGGHIFPAIAIANQIKKEVPGAELLFVGAQGKMEMEKVPAAGYKIIGLNISGFKRSLSLSNFKVLFKIMESVSKSKKIIREFKPNVVVGVGGYASGPLLYAANKKKINTLIQEQNSYPGITNKILSKRAKKICVAYDNMNRFFDESKIIKTGNPLRSDILKIDGKREKALQHFGLLPNKKTVLVIGGSLGARTINQSIAIGLKELADNDIQVIWQTGKFYFDAMQKEVTGELANNIKVLAFIKEMDLAYAAADLIVSRAGAGTISELSVVGKPCIFIPSPNVSEDHQTKNANALVEKNAAVLIKDVDSKDKLSKAILDLLNNSEQLNKLSNNIKEFALPNAAENIVNEILKLAKAE
ncbi:MAG: undecaprenyldiphospho-muramoylpentapeptide beta-N-acetylglucosaminyltransferase [Bacteroidia bacterium]|nr:undecaprenyldiphospho-muramoylpentapeptide beta-N-acetylglucosaminyltransferase [Bacteroidia bacterium]NNM16731.1 undecaprenyldiphospho-muramoylpentapeptide beta-N-acetylglucosaminyltransferase [Bacteroidia bacterium]